MTELQAKNEPSPELWVAQSPERIPNAEPKIDVAAVSNTWRIAFKFHWIFFAICFTLLVAYNGYQLFKTYRSGKIANRTYVSIVQTLVILLGITRALALCLSPYELTSNTPNRVPYVIIRLLFSFGYPCLFSGFTFVHKIFLNVSKVQVLSRKALGNKLVVIVLVIHFIGVVSSEILTSKVQGLEFVIFICALYYFMGCLGIALSLMFSGRRVIQKTRQIQSTLTEYNVQTTAKKNGELIGGIAGKPKTKTAAVTSKVMRITAFASAFGVLCALFYIYTLYRTFRVAIGDKSLPSPWPWLIVNTFLRFFELCLAATMSYAVGSCYQRSAHTRILVSRCDHSTNLPLSQ